VIDLSAHGTLESLLALASANHRGDVRRRLRQLAGQGQFDLWIPGPDDIAAAHEDWAARFVPAYRRQWAQKGGGVLASAGAEALLSIVIREGIAEGWGSYRALRLDGRTIAWAILLREGTDDYWWVPAYDLAHDELAPGKVMLALLVERSMVEGRRALHLLTGAQSYKMAWRPVVPPRVAVGWHTSSWRGRALQAYDAWRAPAAP
jgi:CelD/BcsL family acetyltransferase involved in cellulose biosynthesis